MNLFEQMATLQRQAARNEVVFTDTSTTGDSKRFVESATLTQLEQLMIAVSARLFNLSEKHSGMAELNLHEAAGFALDVAKDIRGAIVSKDDEPCNCYKCDDCQAAVSDEFHDRRKDAKIEKCD